MYVDVATATNSCQPKNRHPKIPGADPCTELETRGGVWRYDANKTNQTFSPLIATPPEYATARASRSTPAAALFVTQHGRDQLHTNWPDLYKPDEEATLPAEELLLLKSGGDYGWPECYYDSCAAKTGTRPGIRRRRRQRKSVCARARFGPAAAFPAHWGPNGWCTTIGKQFPGRYRDGVFIAFHGSWNRAPYPQGGYNVVFQPLAGDRASGPCEIFADGFAGAVKRPRRRDPSADRACGRAGRRALRFRRHPWTDLSNRLPRRVSW